MLGSAYVKNTRNYLFINEKPTTSQFILRVVSGKIVLS